MATQQQVDETANAEEEMMWAMVDSKEIELQTYESLLLRSRQNFLRRFEDRRRPKLIWWKRIVWATAIMRMFCCFGIIVALIYFRYFLIRPLISQGWQSPSLNSEVYNIIFSGMFMLISLCIIAIYMDFMICFAAAAQHPQRMMMAFASAQAAVMMICYIGCFSGGAAQNVDAVSATIFGEKIKLETTLDRIEMYNFQKKYQCCGAYGPEDWLKFEFFSWYDIGYDMRFYVENRMGWMSECSKDDKPCAAPKSCCKNEHNCYGYRIVEITYLDQMMNAGGTGDSKKVELLQDKFDQSNPGINRKGCYTLVNEWAKMVLKIVGVLVFILCLLATIMILLMIAGLLYHSAHGHMDKENFAVVPATTDILVWFFMWLDGLTEPEEFTLTNFSIIEELKRLDIDDRLQDDTTSEIKKVQLDSL